MIIAYHVINHHLSYSCVSHRSTILAISSALFLKDHIRLVEKALEKDAIFEEWKSTPRGTVALIIVLDQFTRNIFRGSAKMFAGISFSTLLFLLLVLNFILGDDQALELTKTAISKKWDELVSLPERLFICINSFSVLLFTFICKICHCSILKMCKPASLVLLRDARSLLLLPLFLKPRATSMFRSYSRFFPLLYSLLPVIYTAMQVFVHI